MKLEYILVVDGKEVTTSGHHVPRTGELVQIKGHEDSPIKSDGTYIVDTVVSSVKPDHMLGETVYFKSDYLRIMLREDKK